MLAPTVIPGDLCPPELSARTSSLRPKGSSKEWLAGCGKLTQTDGTVKTGDVQRGASRDSGNRICGIRLGHSKTCEAIAAVALHPAYYGAEPLYMERGCFFPDGGGHRWCFEVTA